LTEDGHLVVAGSRLKVVMLVQEHLLHKWDAEQIQLQHPDLTLGEVHSALAYYYDHRDEMDELIRKRRALEGELRIQAYDAALQGKLREIKQH
jgi:uncharacterized protein (DUF433 family)